MIFHFLGLKRPSNAHFQIRQAKTSLHARIQPASRPPGLETLTSSFRNARRVSFSRNEFLAFGAQNGHERFEFGVSETQQAEIYNLIPPRAPETLKN